MAGTMVTNGKKFVFQKHGITPTGTITLSTKSKTDVSAYQYAQVESTNVQSYNIKGGVTILGVTGTLTPAETLQVVPRTLSCNLAWSSIAYGNGTFVAVAHGQSNGYTETKKYVYSADRGATWNQNEFFRPELRDAITFGNGIFVTVGDSSGYNKRYGYADYSSDGITWTNVSLPDLSRYGSYSDVVYGNGKFVAVSTDGFIVYSLDAATWEKVVLTSTTNQIYYTSFANGRFFVYGQNQSSLYTSTDGISWSSIDVPFTTDNNTKIEICYGAGKYLCVTNNYVYYSYDGVTWHTYSVQIPSSLNIYAGMWLQFEHGRFMVLSHNSSAGLCTSVDGFNWSACNKQWDVVYEVETRGRVAYGDGLFLQVGSNLYSINNYLNRLDLKQTIT